MFLTLFAKYDHITSKKNKTENNSQEYRELGFFTKKLGALSPSIALQKLQNGVSDTLNFVLTQALSNPALTSTLIAMSTQVAVAQAASLICESRLYTVSSEWDDDPFSKVVFASYTSICDLVQQNIGDDQCGEFEIEDGSLRFTAMIK